MITLTRRYRFSASHRLHVISLSAAENAALFGKCNNPFGHGHDYVLSITIAGEPDPETGVFVPIAKLDGLVKDHVLRLFSHRNLNLDVMLLKDVVPTTENVVSVIAKILEEQWPAWFGNDSPAKPARVQLQETERNGFTIQLATHRSRVGMIPHHESVPVNV